MERITAFEEYAGRIRAFRAEHPGARTNCFLMPDELRRSIGQERLYVWERREVLLVLKRWADGYACFYYLDPKADTLPELPGRELPLVMNIPVRAARGMATPPAETELFVKAGFRTAAIHMRMKKTLGEAGNGGESTAMTRRVRKSNRLTAEMIGLWRASIHPLSTQMPERPGALQENQQVYFVEEQGRLAAALLAETSGRCLSVEHVSTHADARGRGLGTGLMTALEEDARQAGITTMQLWVDERNIPALALYGRQGFAADGLVSIQLVMDVKNAGHP